ncbi:MAG: hypothetical protein Q9160_000832 [Pyrenula sp. 1 TL-2023]
MASVQSLGLHEPTALPYLISESLLPPDPSGAEYASQTYAARRTASDVEEEEITTTKDCVVWSRGGVVKRVYRLDIERESITQAFVALFASNSNIGKPDIVEATRPLSLKRQPSGVRSSNETNGDRKEEKQTGLHARFSSTPGDQHHRTAQTSSPRRFERALVVILKTQAHIYFISGDSFVVPLPFEVQNAFPTSEGFVLQRKLSESDDTRQQPSAPHNSIVSSQVTRGPHSSQSTFRVGQPPKPSLTISTASDFKWPTSRKKDVKSPRLYSLTDPQAQIGLVIATNHNRYDGSLGAVASDEELLYLSRKGELYNADAGEDLYLAVTSNAKSNTYTAWKVTYHRYDDPFTASRPSKSNLSGYRSRRKSSNVFGMGTGATTPAGNAPENIRESFGTVTELKPQDPSSAHLSHQTNREETLASQLGPEFGEVGVQTRAARRASSMLARAELGTSHDQSTFHELANGASFRSSLNRAGRKGESFGSVNTRASIDNRRGNSLPGNDSILSTGSSFLNLPADHLLEELNKTDDIEILDHMGSQGDVIELPREVLFSKIESFPRTAAPQFGQTINSDQIKVFVLPWPSDGPSTAADHSARLSLCIHDSTTFELTVFEIKIQRHEQTDESYPIKGKKEARNSNKSRIVARASGFTQASDIIGATKVIDGSITRIMTLTNDANGTGIVSLEAPWSTSFKIDLPRHLTVYDPFLIAIFDSPKRRREGSLKRIISSASSSLTGFREATAAGQVDVVDSQGRSHRLCIQLEPKEEKVRTILETCRLILPLKAGDGLLITWWEVLRWLRQTAAQKPNKEWTALVVVLFCLAVPFTGSPRKQKSSDDGRKKSGSVRSGVIRSVKASSWQQAMEQEISSGFTEPAWTASPSWAWVVEEGTSRDTVIPNAMLRTKALSLTKPSFFDQDNTFILKCIELAREFLSTSTGQAANGSRGYLPTAASQSNEARRTSLAKILVVLHLIREEQKLDMRTDECFDSETLLSPIIGQIGEWLGWSDWSWKENSYYASEIPDLHRWQFEDTKIQGLETPGQPFTPPSILSFIEESAEQDRSAIFFGISNVLADGRDATRYGQHGLLQQESAKLTPRTVALCALLPRFLKRPFEDARYQAVLDSAVTPDYLRTFPDGISGPFFETLVKSQLDPPRPRLERLIEFIGRDDLLIDADDDFTSSQITKASGPPSHEATRDYHGTGNASTDTEVFHSFDASTEADRITITKLAFREDRRIQDAAKLVNQLRAPVAECNPEPDWSEADLLEAQKDLVQLVTLRTLAVSLGRGMMQYNSRLPLLTEKVHIPAFTLQCLMRPMGVTLGADRASFTEEKVCWAFFHNGTSTGLTISKAARGIDTSWILHNKPNDLTNRHAGFLLALGLNGHLKSLAKWVAFKYLTPKHTMTSIGLLLGLSASYLGTMDSLITRLLSVHVTRMLPPGAAELNLSPLTQTTGLMGIGLLYCASQHRRMSEVMLSEIESTAPENSPSDLLRDEGYRLAAGFSLGLINLGKGSNLLGLRDMNVIERLLGLAMGTRNVNMVPVLDRATAGATVAIALMFMKTNNVAIARKIDIPDTVHQFDYVRPDVFLLRTVARHLILWSRIRPTHNFIRSSIPKPYRFKANLKNIRQLSTEDTPFFNILAGVLLAMSLRFAGSGSLQLRNLLIVYLDQFMRLTRLPASNYDAKLTRNAVRNCQDVIALALSAVMAGTGDLRVFRRLRSLHGRLDPDTTYGSHLAAHMAIGALFLGGGTHTFGTGDVAVASLLCAFYPLFPTTVLDNKAHLQAFRHLWVLATEPRCLVTRDVYTRRPISVSVAITMKDGTNRNIVSPSLIPDLAKVLSLEIVSPEYWPVTINFQEISSRSNDGLATLYSRISALYLRRRNAYDAPQMPPLLSTLQAIDDAKTAPRISSTDTSATFYTKGANPLEWLWGLSAFRRFDMAERELVLPPFGTNVWITALNRDGRLGNGFLGHSPVDVKLSLEKGILSDSKERMGKVSKDQLWQLRLLFAWLNREVRENAVRAKKGDETRVSGQDMWLRREVIESLKWRVWRLRAGLEENNAE